MLLCTGKIWAGWNDEGEEGTFRDPNTGALLSSKLDMWYAGEPNGGRMENCAMVWIPRKAWNDLSCTDFCHGFCYINARPQTQMRGTFLTKSFITIYPFFFLKDFQGTWFLIDSLPCQPQN